MEEKKQKDSNLTWPSAAVVAAVAAVLAHNAAPLHSSRPNENLRHDHTARGDQNVEARLWQDPFAAVAAYQTQEAEKESKPRPASRKRNRDDEFGLHTVEEVSDQILRRTSAQLSDAVDVTVFCVMVSNGPYVEDAERRMRTRYAVVSGLGADGFVPSDQEHIGYFAVHWPRGAYYECIPCGQTPELSSMTNLVGDELLVPFEWFEPNSIHPPDLIVTNQTTRSILLLWLDSNAFGDYPCRRFAQLITELRKAPDGREQANGKMHFKLLDPSLGDIFQEKVQSPSCSIELPCTNRFSVASVLSGIQVYSSWSTTADALLVSNASGPRRETVRWEMEKKGLEFFNATATDDEMTRRLIDELGRRGVDLSNPDEQVALVSESDTFYGRALPLTFAANVILRRTGDRQPVERFPSIVRRLQNNSISWPENVHFSSYLRGIDGRLPHETTAPSSEAEPKQQDKSKDIKNLERPEGPSQLDYMPRLAAELREHEEQLEHDGHSGFKAIGILGSDVYDKLLLLQSLHNLFPHAVFFTTDLDARLLHPKELNWTRNLIVASSFDLKLNDMDYRRDSVPPFRDSYQTGQYLATLVAFGSVPATYLENVQARLFEVSRNGAYILDPPRSKEDIRNLTPSIYPERPRLTLGWKALWFSLALMAGFLLLHQYSRPIQGFISMIIPQRRRPNASPSLQETTPHENCLRQIDHGTKCSVRTILGCLLLLGVGLAFLICHDHNRDGGEPFSLLAGISLWPSEIFNLAAAALAWFFLAKGFFDLRRSEVELAQEFSLEPLSRSDIGAQRCINFLRWDWRDKEVDAASLWEQNLAFGHWANRLLRCGLAAGLYFILAILLVCLFGLPFRPYRGEANLWADAVLSVLSTASVVILIFFVVDATLLCNRFVEHLCSHPTKWPPPLIGKPAEASNMDQKDLPEWLGIQFIAKRTEAVGRLIFYPFIVLFLMIVSRNSFFDHFDWPISLLLLFGLLAAYAIACVITLRNSAEKARKQAIRQLKEKLIVVQAAGDENKAKPITYTLAEIAAIEGGAFAPFSQHPVLKALAMPFGGAGLLTLLDYLALMG